MKGHSIPLPREVLSGDRRRASESPAAGLGMQQDGHRSPRHWRGKETLESVCYGKDVNISKRRMNCEIILSAKTAAPMPVVRVGRL